MFERSELSKEIALRSTVQQKAAGWKSLFDGKNLTGWRNFKKQTIGAGWIVDNGAIHLNAKKNPDGGK